MLTKSSFLSVVEIPAGIELPVLKMDQRYKPIYYNGLYKNKHEIFYESGMAFEMSEVDADAARVISERMRKMFEKNRYGEKETANWDRFYRDFLSQNLDILYDANNLVVKKNVRRILLDEQYIQIGGQLDEIKFTRKKDE
jgi:hypothetical protein